MVATVKVTMGRQRVTSRVSSLEAGYIRHMRDQTDTIAAVLQYHIDRIGGPVTKSAILEALLPIEKKSQERVPEDTGKLKRSFFKEARQRRGKVTASIGYAKGGNPWYAALVHENVHLRHAKGKQAKFLESAVFEEDETFFRRLAYLMTIKSQLKGNKYG